MHIVLARILFKIPCICHDCGACQLSDTKEISVEGTDPKSLVEIIEGEGIGYSFSVGWSSNWAPERNIYRCPQCTEKRNK